MLIRDILTAMYVSKKTHLEEKQQMAGEDRIIQTNM